jgi:membrane-associated phospholipid phosphatase
VQAEDPDTESWYYMTNPIARFGALVVVIVVAVWADTTGTRPGFWRVLTSTGSRSPYTLDWRKDGLYLLGAGGAYALGSAYFNNGEPMDSARYAGLSKDNVPFFDRGVVGNHSPTASEWSDRLNTAISTFPLALAIGRRPRRDFVLIGLMYGQSVLLYGTVSNLTKELVKRPRPIAYDHSRRPDKPDTYIHHSFISGHSGFSFTVTTLTATVFQDYYPDSKAVPFVWGGGMAFAVGASVCRYYSGDHFPTDLMAGAVVGFAAGRFVPWLHRKRGDKPDLALYPVMGTATGVRLVWRPAGTAARSRATINTVGEHGS